MRPFAPLVLALLLAGPALAAPPAQPAPKPQPKVFLSPSGEPFRAGPATPDAFKAWFDQADADHDGSIDRTEFRADAARFFKRLDANGDGIIDGFELAAYEQKIVPELAAQAEDQAFGDFDRADAAARARADTGAHIPGHGEAREPPEKGHLRPAFFVQLLDEPEPVAGADFNLDSHINLDEWMKATDERFELLDAGKTGKLAYEALKARLAGPPASRRGR